jgi:ergothioneine biosynthesis protein EgtB
MHDARMLTQAVYPAREIRGPELAAALRDSRGRTLSLVDDLSDAQWYPPVQSGINPIAWELAHIAWFGEFWILRGPHHRDALGLAQAQFPPKFAGPDALLDSMRLAHAQRWVLPMPSRAELMPMMRGQLGASIQAIPAAIGEQPTPGENNALYFHRLALFHEDMHAEAFCWMRAALGYSAPRGLTLPNVGAATQLAVAGADILIGNHVAKGDFAFDNECPAKSVSLRDFQIDSSVVSAGEFARFVESGGYATPRFWPAEAGRWRAQSTFAHPQRWRRDNTANWEMQWFDQWMPLDLGSPAMHLNAFEAEAYCLWAKRRLPTAAEWEHSAQTQASFQWGHSVWEWTADTFEAYPGFEPGPYREYSQPWFGNHRELRGGSFATHTRMHHSRYRNFFQPHRHDVFAGFRTTSL